MGAVAYQVWEGMWKKRVIRMMIRDDQVGHVKDVYMYFPEKTLCLTLIGTVDITVVTHSPNVEESEVLAIYYEEH